MASITSFIAVLIMSVALVIMGISCSYKIRNQSDALKQAEQELSALRFRLKEMGSRNGITDMATLKLTTEIVRIENNLSRMSKSSSHYKPLSESVGRMKSILMAEGYEMVDYLARPYSRDIKAKACFCSDGQIREEDSVIISVQKAQVNYCGENIQQGHVTVVDRQHVLQHPRWVLCSLYKKIKKISKPSITSGMLCGG